MPKQLKKKVSAKKPKKVAKKKTPSAKKPKKVESKVSFMWEFLKKKEAERKRLAEQNQSSLHFKKSDGQLPVPAHQQGFSRFAGPRRRAA